MVGFLRHELRWCIQLQNLRVLGYPGMFLTMGFAWSLIEQSTSREPAHLTSSRSMVIQPILAEHISENPDCSGNCEGFDGFAPIRMIVGIRKKHRYPHE